MLNKNEMIVSLNISFIKLFYFINLLIYSINVINYKFII